MIRNLWLTLGLCLALAGAGCGGADSAPAPEPAEKSEAASVDDAGDALLRKMREELGEKFRCRRVRCFVAASDASPATFDRLCTHTLGACHDAYRKQFLKKAPTRVYRVYLFADAKSYETNTKRLFGRMPTTPFGYYSRADRALVMNIGTGGGTLVHEMFHAFADEDFPDIPAWANEGIASLFEQCRIVDGRLEGLVNWRLPILQKQIRDGTLPTLRTIFTMSDADFYTDRQGKYAAARYFMQYLQEKGVLERFYKSFREGHEKDRTGVRFVEEVLGRRLEDVEPEWRKWVMDLRR